MRVAVIGAGITGLYLAWKLSESGHKVTVFEKRNVIGKEACSGLFSERILQFIPQSEKLIQNQVNFTLIHFPRKTVKVDFERKFFVMNHAELDRLVADLAQSAGAEIILECDTVSLISHVTLSSDFDRVIGCDGANSGVRKSLGLPEPEYRLGILGFVSARDNSNYVEVWPVGNGFTPHLLWTALRSRKLNLSTKGAGFIWKIPRGDKLEYGVIADPQEARQLLDDFCRKNNLLLENIKSALIPQGFLIPKAQKITLCGDAAGLTKPWSGGGVIWGLTAAELLLKNFPDLLKYQQAVRKTFYYKIIFSKLFAKAVYFLGFNLPWLLPKKIKMEGDSLCCRKQKLE